MLIAQITDLHVAAAGSPFDLRWKTGDALARAVEHLLRLAPRPDVVVCTGDLVNEGAPDEYAHLLARLAPLPMPWFALPGNHDHRDHLRAALADRGYLPPSGPLLYAVDAGPLRLVALDTTVPGRPGGHLGAEQLAWLDARLAERAAQPTLVLMHHPPFATGIAAMDAMGLDDADDLARVIARHPQVERILCGHLHRPIVRRFAGTIASTCPSTGAQVALDLRPGAPLAVVENEPAACYLHYWNADSSADSSERYGLVSHMSYVI